MYRREFLKKGSKAASLAAVTGLSAYLFYGRETWSRGAAVYTKANAFEIDPDKNLPALTLARNADHRSALRSALEGIGSIKRFIAPGEKVTIKPNIGWDRTPAQAANTNPVLVGEMVRQCLAAGATEVIVTDVTCNEARRCFMRSGISEAVEQAGGRTILPADDDFLDADLRGELLTTWPVLKHFLQTDRLINMPIIKQHSLSEATVGMKNLYGIIGGRRNQLHQKIDQSIVDLATFCKPTLTVIDGTRVLLRGGPQGGSLDDVAIHDTVICATDQVAGDARSVDFLGLAPNQVGHIKMAHRVGLGEIDYQLAGYKEMA